MGTDRDVVHEGACTCGRGKYIINVCSPDHAWARARQTTWETEIACPDCSKQFAIERQGNDFCRVRKADVQAKADAANAAHAKGKEIETHAEHAGHYEALTFWIGSMPSVAAVHGAVTGITGPSSLSAFRNHFDQHDVKGWVKRCIHYFWLPEALKRIGRSDARIDELLMEHSELSSKSTAKAEVLEVIYSKKPMSYTSPGL
jgi:hypothetical protein